MSKFEASPLVLESFLQKFINVVFPGEMLINKNTKEFQILHSFNATLQSILAERHCSLRKMSTYSQKVFKNTILTLRPTSPTRPGAPGNPASPGAPLIPVGPLAPFTPVSPYQ